MSKVWEVQDRSRRKDRREGKSSAKTRGEIRDIRGVKRSDRNENVFARPNGLRENAEIAVSCRGPGPARRKKEVYQ